MGGMKTTLEIPDFLFRRAKSVAAERGIPLRQLVTEAVQEKLKATSTEKPWMKHLGKLKHVHKERRQVEKRVEEAFEQIDQELSSGLSSRFRLFDAAIPSPRPTIP